MTRAESECYSESVSRPTRAKSSSDEQDQLRATRLSQQRRLRNAAKQLRRKQRKNEVAERRQRSLDDFDAALAEFGLR